MKAIKLMSLVLPVILLTGCVSVEVVEENECYRFVDYQNEEHYITLEGGHCSQAYGNLTCSDGTHIYKVNEFEYVECPAEVEE